MSDPLHVRDEQLGDEQAIHNVHACAFGRELEARLVDLLRAAGKAIIGLVGCEGERVVGHILFSPITIANAPTDLRGLALGPVGVLPERQRRGIGSALIREGLARCEGTGYDLVILLGHVTYYPRFGFKCAKAFGLDNEYGAEDAFMVRELKPGILMQVSGLVKFAPEFRDAGA
jgi:putative acetyltransferase